MNKLLKVGLILGAFCAHSSFAQDTIKIGFVGTLSGPNAAWGRSNVRSMETSADIYNSQGGVEIGGKKYTIDIVSFDDAYDPKIAVAGMEKMAQEKIAYVVGPNDDAQANAVRPIAERNNIVYFPYAFDKSLYTKPANNAVFGMIASYQWEPSVYKWLKENKGVKTIAFIAANAADPLNQRDNGIKIAEKLGLKVVEAKATYTINTRDFYSVMTPIIKKKPDLLVLSGVSPATAPLIIKTARELGFKGHMAAGTALDASILKEGAGNYANGFICQGGVDEELQSEKMKDWVKSYTKKFGEYNDESNTKVFALEYILAVMKSNPKSISDTDEFLKMADSGWSVSNPFLKNKDTKFKFVGKTSYGQNRQLGVPLTPKIYVDGEFKTLFVGSAD